MKTKNIFSHAETLITLIKQNSTKKSETDPNNDPHLKHVIDIIAKEFDIDYYLANNIDVKDAEVDPIIHYNEFGWREGRNPTPDFNTKYYLEINEDVRDAEVNPFYHFLVAGRDEGRACQTDINETSTEEHNSSEYLHIVDTIKPNFDTLYYLTMYSDVADQGIDPIEHYINYGWKEYRDPSAWFSSRFYLNDNPDVASANINPFYHYLAAGKSERRFPQQPGGSKATSIFNIESLESIKENWQVSAPRDVIDGDLTKILREELKNRNIISFSHDVYLKNTGGVQLCIGIEETYAKAIGIGYLHLAPYQPLPTVSEISLPNDFFYNVTVNGSLLGTASHNVLIKALKKVKGSFIPVIHAVHGHSIDLISELIQTVRRRSTFYWIHDYISICEGYHLLRNHASFCNAPPPSSQACTICIYGESRFNHLKKVGNLFSKFSVHAIAPSDYAAKLWREKTCFKIKSIETINHLKLFKYKRRKDHNYNDKIRIGFIGFPAYHKGWDDFTILVKALISDTRFEFFHIGAQHSEELPIKFIQTNTCDGDCLATRNALIDNEIDFVFIPSKWPETYNLVCYEAIAAGAKIITYQSSGNVATEIKNSNLGLVVDGIDDAVNVLRFDQDLSNHLVERNIFNIQHSRMTFDSKVITI